MNDIIELVENFGLSIMISVILIYFVVKYTTKFLDYQLDRAKSKDFQLELLTKTIDHNSVVIKNNTTVIKNYTDNAHKLEDKIDDLINKMK